MKRRRPHSSHTVQEMELSLLFQISSYVISLKCGIILDIPNLPIHVFKHRIRRPVGQVVVAPGLKSGDEDVHRRDLV